MPSCNFSESAKARILKSLNIKFNTAHVLEYGVRQRRTAILLGIMKIYY